MIDTIIIPVSPVTQSSLSNPRDITEGVLSLPISLISLTQCTGFKVGEPFRDDVVLMMNMFH